MAHFEKVPKYKDVDVTMPRRGTAGSAGYDMFVAEDTVIPPFEEQYHKLKSSTANHYGTMYALDALGNLTKETGIRPTLVSTGVCVHLEPRTYLKVVARSSTPLKYWLVVANSEAIIDSDYVDADNHGEIFVQLINLSPFPIKLQKGETIAQGIICHYGLTNDDDATGKRTGGFGSTTPDEAQNLYGTGVTKNADILVTSITE